MAENGERLKVQANPAKSFFVSMLIKDITLRDAIGDLVDNAVDAIKQGARVFAVDSDGTSDDDGSGARRACGSDAPSGGSETGGGTTGGENTGGGSGSGSGGSGGEDERGGDDH